VAKIYKISSRGNTWEVLGNNTKQVKEYIAAKFGMKQVPKGTVVEKIGLTKETVTSVTVRTSDTSEPAPSSTTLEAGIKAARNVRKKRSNAASKEERDFAKREEIKKDTIFINGGKSISVRKSLATKLTKKVSFCNCEIVYKIGSGDYQWAYIGEDTLHEMRRGTIVWIHNDHTETNKNIKLLEEAK
jgi:hypothetical protein